MRKRDLRPLLDALPLPTPAEQNALDQLRWALGDALPESQRARMPQLQPLAPLHDQVLDHVIRKEVSP